MAADRAVQLFASGFTSGRTAGSLSSSQTASQEKNESPEMFLDRLRKLCERTIQRSESAVEQAVIILYW